MLPHVDWSPSFPLVLLASSLLAIAVHELGHAAAGSLAGVRIVACGVGFGRPLLHGRLLGVCFFLARFPTGGLTLAVSDRPWSSRPAMVFLLAGGPLANLLSA